MPQSRLLTLLDLMWTVMDPQEVENTFENILISLLTAYRCVVISAYLTEFDRAYRTNATVVASSLNTIHRCSFCPWIFLFYSNFADSPQRTTSSVTNTCIYCWLTPSSRTNAHESFSSRKSFLTKSSFQYSCMSRYLLGCCSFHRRRVTAVVTNSLLNAIYENNVRFHTSFATFTPAPGWRDIERHGAHRLVASISGQ